MDQSMVAELSHFVSAVHLLLCSQTLHIWKGDGYLSYFWVPRLLQRFPEARIDQSIFCARIILTKCDTSATIFTIDLGPLKKTVAI